MHTYNTGIFPLCSSAISVSFEDATYQLIEGEDVLVTVVANGTSTLPFTVNITTTPGTAEGGFATQLCTLNEARCEMNNIVVVLVWVRCVVEIK